MDETVGEQRGDDVEEKVWAGVEVGKGFHWAHVMDASGEALLSRRVENDEADLLKLIDAVLRLTGDVAWATDQPGGITTLMGLRLAPDRADDASRMLDGSGIHLYLPPNVEPRHLEALCSDLLGAILAWAGGIAVGYAPLLQEGGGEEEAEAPPELRDTDFRGRRIAYVTALPEDPAAHAPVLESARRTASSLVAPHNDEPAIAYLPPGVDLWAWLKGRVRAERRPAFSDLLGRAEALGLPKETRNPGSEAAGVEGADDSQASEADAPAGEGTPPASELGAGPAHITRTPEERAKVRSRRQGRQAYRRPIPPQERFTKRERVAAAFVAVVVAVALWRLLLFVGGLAGDTLPEFLAAYPLPIAIVVGMLAGLYVWRAHAAKRERETRLLGGQAKT